MMSAGPYQHNLEHLQDELAWLDLNIQSAVQRLRALRQDGGDGYVSDRHVDHLLDHAGDRTERRDDAALRESIDAGREAINARVAASIETGVPLRLPRLATLFGLTPFEADILVICLAPEASAHYEHLYAYLQDDATRRAPRVDLVLNLLCRTPLERASGRSAFLSTGRLFRYSLLQFVDDDAAATSLLARTLKLDAGVAHYLLGGDDLDARIASCCRLVAPAGAGGAAGDSPELLAPFARYLSQPSSRQWIAVFSGRDRVGQQDTARHLCSATGVPLLELDLNAALDDDTPISRRLPVLFREAALKGAAVWLEPTDALRGDGDRAARGLHALERSVEELGWITFLAGEQPLDLGDALKPHLLFTIDFPLPGYPERKRIWHDFVGNGHSTLPIADLAARFRFTRREIRNAMLLASTRALLRGGEEGTVTRADVEAACRAESNSRLIAFARKVEHTYSWHDLVLPGPHKAQLREIVDHVRNHEAVYTEWGFRRKHALGKGVNMLFSGPSGTGKTMAAGIIASELGLDCYKIDLSTVVSKYIGETEKNLNRIFAEAETSNAVLFFDEADALFGKRTEVKDSHDRYANIEVNYLLQKMEEHEGVVVLATNLSRNVDEAFLRRVHFSVVFPLPEKDERLLVWQHVFPPQAPLGDDVDREFLARRLKITGGNIKNIAVGAAFLARREDSHITMRHVVLSAKREFQKMGKLTTRAEFGDYHDLTQ